VFQILFFDQLRLHFTIMYSKVSGKASHEPARGEFRDAEVVTKFETQQI